MPYGGAASSLALLFAITQLQSRAPDVQLAVFAAVISLPLWLVHATIIEFYLFLGPASFPHYKGEVAQRLVRKLSAIAGTALVLGIGGLVHCILAWATWVYVGAIGLAFYFLHEFNVDLADWWHEQENKPPHPDG
jgi:hypothetical protein